MPYPSETDAFQARTDVLAHVGDSKRLNADGTFKSRRGTADTRIINDVTNNDRGAGTHSQTTWFATAINVPDTWGEARFSSDVVDTSAPPNVVVPPPCESSSEICDDGIDNDCDGLADALDTDDCKPPAGACDNVTACIDDDGCCVADCDSRTDSDCTDLGAEVVCTDNADGTKSCKVAIGRECAETDGDGSCVVSVSNVGGCAAALHGTWSLGLLLFAFGIVFRRRGTVA